MVFSTQLNPRFLFSVFPTCGHIHSLPLLINSSAGVLYHYSVYTEKMKQNSTSVWKLNSSKKHKHLQNARGYLSTACIVLCSFQDSIKE